MELRHLRYFVTVAETMNFRQAAKKLNMTQPPLSQQIQQLEDELGFKLFHREGRSIKLTDAGAVFLDEAQRILDQVGRAVLHGRQAARGEVGQLHIGFVGSVAYSLLPKALRAFRRQFPQVHLTLSELPSDQQLQALSASEIDLGLGWFTDDDIGPDLHIAAIARERLCAVLPREHHLAKQQTFHVADLHGEPFILFPRRLGTYLFDRIAAVCQDAGFTLHIEQEAIHLTTIVGLVAAGMGVSLLPASVMALSRADVVYRMLPESQPSVISAVCRRDTTSPVVDNFMTTLQDVQMHT